ncbi:hypothetical protein KJ997_05600 [bacterium]|nr:hypothetical protein [bacterium]
MLERKEEVRSILVVRSAPLIRTFEALKKLRQEYSKSEISILLQPEVKDEIEKTGLANKVIVGIRKGRISLFRHLPLILQLRIKVFDLVAIIYNTKDISWYGNLRLFASAIKAKERVGITTENILQPFSANRSILILILKPFRLIFAIPLLIIFIISLVPLILFYHLRRGLRRLSFKKRRAE